MGYRIINGKAYPVGNIGDFQRVDVKKNNEKAKESFKNILNKTLNEKEITISKHASERLRDINFTDEDMNKIEKGFKLAEEKGSRNSVMLYKDVAIIASIENKTIITAIEKTRSEENIFTNIDSVVVL